MNDLVLMPDWSGLFLGLFALFAGIGELRKPGHWQRMMDEITRSPALQVITALIELFVGAIVYIVNPWSSPGWLAHVMSVLGALMCIEALLILAFSDRYLPILARRLGVMARVWAIVSVAFGLILIVLALPGFMNA
ncbi:hypothetical protein WBP06_12280 [Novosphingobium sp. BL-8H]|uniref:hypothetical protein n=1 Tax=Novosphingobium sp. BL-8H TaxID=3127640 RepID=UPI003758124C